MTSTPTPLERAETSLPAFVSMSGPQKTEKGLEIQVAALLSIARSLEVLAEVAMIPGALISPSEPDDEPAEIEPAEVIPANVTSISKPTRSRPTLKEKLAAELAAKTEAEAEPVVEAAPVVELAVEKKDKKTKKDKKKAKKDKLAADSTPAPAVFLEDLDVELDDDDDDEDPLGDNSGEGGRSFEV